MTDLPAVKWMPKPFPVPNAEAKTEAEMKDYAETLPSTDVKFDMVPIKGGKFKMGSPATEKGRKADEGPQVEVAVEPFWMGKYEVTWDEYEIWGLRAGQAAPQGQAGRRPPSGTRWPTPSPIPPSPTPT